MGKRIVAVIAISMLMGVQPLTAASGKRRPPMCFDKQATRVGTRGDDVIRGTRRSDVIVALAGDDKVFGFEGNDLICAGSGADTVEGQYGDDLVDGGAGGDTLDGGPDVDHVSGGGGDDSVLGGIGDGESDTVVGGDGDDFLKVDGNASISYLFGGTGRDEMWGSNSFPDFFYPGSDTDPDFVNAGYGSSGRYGSDGDLVSYRLHPSGVDIDLTDEDASATEDYLYEIDDVEGSLFDDLLVGDDGANQLIGHDGDDEISALGENDYVDGGLGDDALDGGEHTPTDYSRGGDGLSFWSSPVGADASLVRGTSSGPGNDTFSGFEHLGGSEYGDRLEGDDEANSLSGQGGYNILLGLDGDDTLAASSGESDGGPGYDNCENQQGKNCETWWHVDNTSTSAIVFPDPWQTYGPAEVTTAEAEARDASSLSPPVDKIRIALRLITEDGCSWWSQRQADLVVRPCERPVFNARITIDRPLPEGPYEARPRARLKGTKTWITGPALNFSILD